MTDGSVESFHLYAPTPEHRAHVRAAWQRGSLRIEVRAGTPFYRVQRAADARQAAQRAVATFPSLGDSRFSPIRDSAGGIVPSSYVGDTPRVALWETALRNLRHEGAKVVTSVDLRERYLVELRLREQLTLLNLERPYLLQLSLGGERAPELSAAWPAAYRLTREWAQMLYEETGARGFVYESHQIAGSCSVFFAPVDPPLFDLVADPVSVTAGDPLRLVLEEAAKLDAAVDLTGLVTDDDPYAEERD